MPPQELPPRGDVLVGYVPNGQGPTSSAIISMILAMTYAQISQAIYAGGGCVWLSRLATSVEVNSLNTVPIVMAAALGLPVNTVIQPVYACMQQRIGAAAYSGATTFRDRWNGIAVDLTGSDTFNNTIGMYALFLNQISGTGSGQANPSPENTDLEWSAAANTTLGSGTMRQTFGVQRTGSL